jgi:hypothetical protein
MNIMLYYLKNNIKTDTLKKYYLRHLLRTFTTCDRSAGNPIKVIFTFLNSGILFLIEEEKRKII